MGNTTLVQRFEAALRIDAENPPESLMRIRAVYVVGVTLIATQLLNMVIVRFNYGHWVDDHIILAVLCAIVVGLLVIIRYYKNTTFYAFAFAVLVIGGTLASAVPDGGGINSAMIPFLAIGPAMCGFMAGKRAAVGTFLAAAVLLGFLYWISLSNAPLMASGDFTRETNRAAQGFFALCLSTLISISISERIYYLVAELRQAADRAQKAESAKSEFLATVSHELRTPLTGVIGLSETLCRDAGDERARRLAATITASSHSMLRILNDLLDLSKLEAAKLDIVPQQVAPRGVVLHVAEAWRESSIAKGVTIVERVANGVPELVSMDDLRVSQILHNLVSNAVKFSRPGLVVLSLESVRLDGGGHHLLFRVSDNGPGVPDDMVEKIFERFEQGRPETARSHGGTGLGLAICRRLAELMGGSIGIEKNGSKGATFLFILPVDEVPVAAPEQFAPIDAFDLSRLAVLVADDNEVNRVVLNEFLSSFGVNADFVSNGAECVASARVRPFDLILLDKEMPDLDGVAAARIIRHSGASMASVIIALTADDREEIRTEFLQAGADDFVMKPLNRPAIGELLQRVAARRVAA